MEMIEAIKQGLALVLEDANDADALVVHDFLVANLTAGAVAVFRDEVVTRVKRDYMRGYMQSRRQKLVREKEAKRGAPA